MRLRCLPMVLGIAAVAALAACSTTNGDKVDDPIVVTKHAGSVSPSYYYEDRISIEGRYLVLTRTGGDLVRTGTWKKKLSKQDIADLKSLEAQCDASDRDVTMSESIVGGPGYVLEVNGVTYREGGDKIMARDPKNVVDLVKQLVDEFGLGMGYGG